MYAGVWTLFDCAAGGCLTIAPPNWALSVLWSVVTSCRAAYANGTLQALTTLGCVDLVRVLARVATLFGLEANCRAYSRERVNFERRLMR